jgi:hypothetical protein
MAATTPLHVAEQCLTRYPAGYRKLHANLIRDPLRGTDWLDLRIFSRPELSDAALEPTGEAVTFPAAQFETLVAAVRALLAEQQPPGDPACPS